MTYLTQDEYALRHFGVKGMRWGVRRAGSSLKRTATSDTTKTVLRRTGKVVRFTGKVALRIGVPMALAAIGIHGATALSRMEEESPGFIGVGRDAIRLQLDKVGVINLNALDKAEIMKDRGVYEVRQGIKTALEDKENGTTTTRSGDGIFGTKTVTRNTQTVKISRS